MICKYSAEVRSNWGFKIAIKLLWASSRDSGATIKDTIHPTLSLFFWGGQTLLARALRAFSILIGYHHHGKKIGFLPPALLLFFSPYHTQRRKKKEFYVYI